MVVGICSPPPVLYFSHFYNVNKNSIYIHLKALVMVSVLCLLKYVLREYEGLYQSET